VSDRFLTGVLVAIVVLLAGGIAVHVGMPYFERALGETGAEKTAGTTTSGARAPAAPGLAPVIRHDDGEHSAFEHGPTRRELPVTLSSGSPAPSGVFVLRARNVIGRGGSLFVPVQATAVACPLLVLFHGTGGSGADMLNAFRPLAEARGIILLAPDSGRSPDGAYNWQVPDSPRDTTPDQAHVSDCLTEVFAAPGIHVDHERVLALGHSGGGSSAAYAATTDARFHGFAVLHGGVFAGGLGSHRVPAWFSTGTEDPLRPPAVVERAAAASQAHATTVTTQLYPGGHDLSDAELRDVIAWWLRG
jgi:phospholipase/carboxylesterase